MIKFEDSYQILYDKIKKFQNGNVVDAMEEKSIVYGKSFGLSLSQIQSLADSVPPSKDYAAWLFQKDLREAKLISFCIDEPKLRNQSDVLEQAGQLFNQELAELAAILFLERLPFAWSLCADLMEHQNLFTRMAGNLLLSRLSISRGIDIPNNHRFFTLLLNQIEEGHSFNRSLAIAIGQLGRTSPANRKTAEGLIEDLRHSDHNYQKFLAEEAYTILAYS